MDPTGIQNRLSGGKRRLDAYSGDEEAGHDNQKVSRLWMTGRADESSEGQDHTGQVNQTLDFRGMSVEQWMRLQQQQKMEPVAPTTPLNLQQPVSLQQRAMAASMHDIRSGDPSKQTILPSTSSQQLSAMPQQSAQQQQQHHQVSNQSMSGGQVHKFQHLGSEQMQQMPYLDLSSSSRPVSSPSTLPPLPLSFRSPPIFPESDLRFSPTSSSSNQYPLQNLISQQQQQQQQRLHPQSSTLLPDSDEERYSSLLSNQTGLQQQHPPVGLLPVSNSLVLQDLQASSSWYPSMRELESQQTSCSRLGRANLSSVQNVGQSPNLYSSHSLADLTCQSGLASLSYQSCSPGTTMRDSPAEQEQLLGDPQSPLPYSISGSSSSPVVGPKCSSSPMSRLKNKPMFQTDFPRRGMLNGPYCPSTSGADLLLNQNMMGNGAGVLPDEGCFIQRAPPPSKPHRTYTKVYKLGAIGRALDVTRFSNYTELRCELARMFNLEGQLDQRSGWQLVFLDNENDMLLVGDDPWEEFVTSVRGIRIMSPSEVFCYMNEDRIGATYNTVHPGSLKQY